MFTVSVAVLSKAGLAVSSTRLRKPSIISKYHNVLQEKVRKVYLGLNYGSFRRGVERVGVEVTWCLFLLPAQFLLTLHTLGLQHGLAHSWIL